MKVDLRKLHVRSGRGRQDFTGIEHLANSLKENGQLQNIVVEPAPDQGEGHYYLIAGERRYRAAIMIGWRELEAKDYGQMTEWEKKQLELIENTDRRDLSWPEQCKLRLDIHNGKKAVGGKGMMIKEIAQMTGESEASVSQDVKLAQDLEDRPDIAERVTHLPKAAARKMVKQIKQAEVINDKVKRGVLKPLTELRFGDCRIEIKKIESNIVDLLETDPPYGLEAIEELMDSGSSKMVQYGMMNKDHNLTLEEMIKMLKELAPEFGRVMKPGAHFYMFAAFQHVGEFINALSPHLEFKPPLVVWKRPKPSAPGLGYNYLSCLEAIIYGFKPPCSRRLKDNKYNILEHPEVPRSIRIYPTEKPVSLLKELIEQSTQQNDLILDPFAGSASTLIAAKELGRRAIGIEKDKEAWARAQDRLINHKKEEKK